MVQQILMTKEETLSAEGQQPKAAGKGRRPNGKDRGHDALVSGGLFSVLLVLCASVFFAYSCGPKYFTRGNTNPDDLKKIAVFPLENFTIDENADNRVRIILISELLSKGVDVVEPGEVTRTFREMKVRSADAVKVAELQEIGRALKADALMLGSVEFFGISRGVSVSYPEVTINLRLIGTSTGDILWSVRNTSGGAGFWTRHFGSETVSLSETAERVVKDALDTLF